MFFFFKKKKSLCSKGITYYKQLIIKDTVNEYPGNKEKHQFMMPFPKDVSLCATEWRIIEY